MSKEYNGKEFGPRNGEELKTGSRSLEDGLRDRGISKAGCHSRVLSGMILPDRMRYLKGIEQGAPDTLMLALKTKRDNEGNCDGSGSRQYVLKTEMRALGAPVRTSEADTVKDGNGCQTTGIVSLTQGGWSQTHEGWP